MYLKITHFFTIDYLALYKNGSRHHNASFLPSVLNQMIKPTINSGYLNKTHWSADCHLYCVLIKSTFHLMKLLHTNPEGKTLHNRTKLFKESMSWKLQKGEYSSILDIFISKTVWLEVLKFTTFKTYFLSLHTPLLSHLHITGKRTSNLWTVRLWFHAEVTVLPQFLTTLHKCIMRAAETTQ